MSKIGVLILNYKKYDDTSACVESVLDSDLPKGSRIYVLDNSSSPAKLEKFSKKFKQVEYIDNGENLGFAGGNNPGIQKAIEDGMDFVLILNPDVRISKMFFAPLLREFGSNSVGLIAPALRHKQKDQQMYGLEGYLDKKLMKASHRNVEDLSETKTIDAEFVTFACVIVSKKVFEKIGFLDTRFFMYLEDVDFCIRARNAGFNIRLCPSVICDHRTSGSFDDPRKKLPISFVSQIKFVDKYKQGFEKLVPFGYYLVFYPYLYLLWTWHRTKHDLGL